MYIVKLSAKDGNNDYQYVNIEVKSNNEEIAINKAVNYYYEKYWSNTEWRKEEFEQEMVSFKNKVDELNDSLFLKMIPNKDTIINEYESELRRHLGATDKSIEEFSKMSLYLKINYLSEIGCELSYFAYPKKSKFESVSI
jgi:hypothetical protein